MQSDYTIQREDIFLLIRVIHKLEKIAKKIRTGIHEIYWITKIKKVNRDNPDNH